MRAPFRIAVLVCDVPLEQTKERFGGYGGMFDVLLQRSVGTLNRPDLIDPNSGLDIQKWDIVNGDQYPKLEDIDAILITGSKHNSFDDEPWINRLVDYTKQVLAQDRIRIVGVCFGHQILGRALGAKVGRSDKEWEVGVHDLDLTEKGKEIFGVQNLRLQQMHRDIVYDCPPSSTVLASTPLCAIHAFYSPGRYIAVQGHPEFDEGIVTEILKKRHEQGIFSDELYETSMHKASREHDGILAGSFFLRFLVGDLDSLK